MSTTDEQRLLPCPFCGSFDIERSNSGDPHRTSFWTICNRCGACTGEVGIYCQDDADSRWNNRAASEPAAPVAARDAQLLKGLRSYLERDRKERFAAGDKRADAAQHFILDIDAAIARQAAAPAEGEKT